MFCVQDSGSDGVVVLLLGNKMDCEEKRQVPTEAGQQLAQVSTRAAGPHPAWTGQTPPWRLVDRSPRLANREGPVARSCPCPCPCPAKGRVRVDSGLALSVSGLPCS